MIIRSLSEAQAVLEPYEARAIQHPKDSNLERMVPLMRHIGNPQERLKVVHIAGTSGKTSTAYYMASLLQVAGLKTGLTVSPHIDSIAERVQIDGRPIAESLFCEELTIFMNLVTQLTITPSYRELLCAFALWEFDRQNVDYAVVETGVGGLHDPTNITRRLDKVCIITDIGLDHTELLGTTLPEIAAQKIGIAQQGSQVFAYEADQVVQAIFEQQSVLHNARLHVVTSVIAADSVLPLYQQRNWQLAYAAFMFIAHRNNLSELSAEQITESRSIVIPARMEVRNHKGKQLILDGAHNTQKMTTFVKSFKALYPGIKPTVLVAVKSGKNYKDIIKPLLKLSDTIIVTSFMTMQGSVEPSELAAMFTDSGASHVVVLPDQAEAFAQLMSSQSTHCVITGSLYLISDMRTKYLT